MGIRIGALIICLLLLSGGCTKPAVQSTASGGLGPESSVESPAAPPASTPPVPVTQPGAPVQTAPRLLLDIPLGDEPDQPGSMPGRVGGVSPRGPVAFAAGWSSIFLVDQAKGRVLRYTDGRLADKISVPWLDEQGNDLRISPFGMELTVFPAEYTVARNGQLLNVRPLAAGSPPAPDKEKGPTPLGKDGAGNAYEWGMGERGPVARRLSKDGSVSAVTGLEAIGEIRDWCLGRDGSLYAMTWQWGQDRIDRVRIWEIFPTVTFPSPPGGMDPATPPVVLGLPVPDRVRLRFHDWAPVEVTSEVERWNLWRLLAAATPATNPPTGEPAWWVSVEAGFPGGSTQTLELRDDYLSVEGVVYQLGTPLPLRSLIAALRLSEPALKQTLDSAQQVTVAIDDLPGVVHELTLPERTQLRDSLHGALAVNPYTPPHPLEQPFPQYAIHLKGDDWTGTLLLVGDRHLAQPYLGAVVHSGRTATLVKSWLPVPDQRPDQVAYLYLADRLEIGAGADLTRWKNTVVRQLIHARYAPALQPAFSEPLVLTFWVKGEKLPVQVDTEGFTYAGKRHPGSGLTGMTSLQGVP